MKVKGHISYFQPFGDWIKTESWLTDRDRPNTNRS